MAEAIRANLRRIAIIEFESWKRLRVIWAGWPKPLDLTLKTYLEAVLQDSFNLRQLEEEAAKIASTRNQLEQLITTGGDGMAESWGASKLRYDSSAEAIEDFIRGQEAEGLIVTITSNIDPFRCLYANNKQAEVRAPSGRNQKAWSVSDWLNNGFGRLWMPSLIATRDGDRYFQRLLELCTQSGEYVDHNFVYQILKTDGSLSECQTRYISVANYGGIDAPHPARIGISRPEDVRVVETQWSMMGRFIREFDF